jgi:hypothetical protein
VTHLAAARLAGRDGQQDGEQRGEVDVAPGGERDRKTAATVSVLRRPVRARTT